MDNVKNFLIFFIVYFSLSIAINKLKGQKSNKSTKDIAITSVTASLIYLLLTIIFNI